MAPTYEGEMPVPVGILTEADENSLAQSRAQLSDDSVPDTLEVRGDSLLLLQDEIDTWRRPAQLALAAAAIGAIAWLGGAVLSRRLGHQA
jgi:hypothetical protein